ncbi:Panacea domain-containing protein [Yoonia algicola]|uniref:Type II toxin-antitoxin system antitoxin SocA domain-containing protein n=1 Tax=Yoonia algicola TaxID=3137368 RepID=A0AAN0NID5_9RHOB
MSTMRAARTIWDGCDGKVSNLSMQKLLYLSHMLELGAGRDGIASHEFEAWDYGPVEPGLYHHLKAYGSSHVPNVFSSQPYTGEDQEYESITEVLQQLGDAPPSKLVAITHWDKGAWSKNYIPGMRRLSIPDEDILEEYNLRAKGE